MPIPHHIPHILLSIAVALLWQIMWMTAKIATTDIVAATVVIRTKRNAARPSILAKKPLVAQANRTARCVDHYSMRLQVTTETLIDYYLSSIAAQRDPR